LSSGEVRLYPVLVVRGAALSLNHDVGERSTARWNYNTTSSLPNACVRCTSRRPRQRQLFKSQTLNTMYWKEYSSLKYGWIHREPCIL